jgi:hypothetical protein
VVVWTWGPGKFEVVLVLGRAMTEALDYPLDSEQSSMVSIKLATIVEQARLTKTLVRTKHTSNRAVDKNATWWYLGTEVHYKYYFVHYYKCTSSTANTTL